METLMQFMVIKKNGTTTLITGIGNSKDFSFADKLASWLGIVLMHINLQIISTTGESQKEGQDTYVNSNANCSDSSKKKKD
jgi:hypothetical protein